MTAGSRRRLTPPRGTKLPAPSAPAETSEVPMQPQPSHPPVQPPVVASDTTLALIWQQHRQAIERAKAAAGLAAPLEQSATGQRAEAKHQREEADRLIAEAADLEAAANQADHDARGHRQDEDFHAATARELAENVAFLVATNRRMHPEEKAQRDADNAAKNAAAAAHPLTAPVGLDHQIPPANPDTTAPFAAAGEQM